MVGHRRVEEARGRVDGEAGTSIVASGEVAAKAERDGCLQTTGACVQDGERTASRRGLLVSHRPLYSHHERVILPVEGHANGVCPDSDGHRQGRAWGRGVPDPPSPAEQCGCDKTDEASGADQAVRIHASASYGNTLRQ